MKNMIAKIKENPEKLMNNLMMCMMFGMLLMSMLNAFPGVWAAVSTADIVDVVFKIIKIVVIALGAFLTILGVVKFAMAYADQNSPDQQKSIMQMASGIALLLLGFVLLDTLSGSVSEWIDEAVK